MFGTAAFDYTEANINFIFLGSTVSHCTGVHYNVPDIPNVLKGKKAHGTVVKQELVVKKIVKECYCIGRIWGHKSKGAD